MLKVLSVEQKSKLEGGSSTVDGGGAEVDGDVVPGREGSRSYQHYPTDDAIKRGGHSDPALSDLNVCIFHTNLNRTLEAQTNEPQEAAKHTINHI